MLEKLFSLLVSIYQDFRRVRFRTQKAFFANSAEEQIFLTITNLSRSRDIEVTHVWIEAAQQVAALPAQRPLPQRLRPDEIWETWVPLQGVPLQLREQVLHLGRLRLSTGRVVKSAPDRDVPSEGSVPGARSERPRR